MEKNAKPRGRRRSFDTDKALDAAMRVFWSEGYEGASLSDLTEAMGINRPSLYAAFGDKEALFRKVLDRYTEGPAAYANEALNQPTALAVVTALLEGLLNQAANQHNPRGCLMIQAGLACGPGAETIRKELARRRGAGEKALRQRLERAKSEEDLPDDADPADLARYITTVIYGMGVQAAGGATGYELERVSQAALRAWPK